MNFVEAMNEELTHVYTENGAKAKNTSGDACLDFFGTVGALRSADKHRIIKLFDAAWNENPLVTLRILFYARDIRGGLGERDTFRKLLRHAANKCTADIKANMKFIPEYGRWDDLLYGFIQTKCESDMWAFIKETLQADLKAMDDGEPVSLLAKWLHNGNESSKRSRALGILTANKLGYSVYEFKRLIVSLRKYMDIVEAKMSTNRWSEINYEHVPSRASMIYRNAFRHHDDERYSAYLDSVRSGNAKIHADTLYPYDIVNKILSMIRDYDSDESQRETLELLWNNLPNYVESGSNVMVIADTSGSMLCSNRRPFATALGLAIYFAQRNVGPYHNYWMSFSERPKFHKIKDESLYDIIKYFDTRDWGSNTNLKAAFELILQTAYDNHVPSEEIPKSLIVISDMEIDDCQSGGWSFYTHMKAKYESLGYQIPNVVFWNVESRHNIFHADNKREGVQLVSGSSPTSFKALISAIGMTPIEFMLSVINSERYSRIHLASAK